MTAPSMPPAPERPMPDPRATAVHGTLKHRVQMWAVILGGKGTGGQVILDVFLTEGAAIDAANEAEKLRRRALVAPITVIPRRTHAASADDA